MQATKTTAQCCGGVYALGKYLTFPSQDTHQATYLAPLASPRRSPAKRVRLGKEERGSGYGAGARKRGCEMERARSDAPPHPSAFLSGSTGFLFALKRKPVECLHHVNDCGTLTGTPAKIQHPPRSALRQRLRYSNEEISPNQPPRVPEPKRLRLGKEERGRGCGAGARKRGCAAEQARSDVIGSTAPDRPRTAP